MKTILIIEDDARVASALAIRLRAAGYGVLKATDGIEGLKLAAHHRPALVLMDVWMPGGVGFLIAQRLKHIGMAEIPVIFLTASKKKDLWEIAEEIGPAGFFEKPYDPKQLLEAIGLAVARAHSPGSVKASPAQLTAKS